MPARARKYRQVLAASWSDSAHAVGRCLEEATLRPLMGTNIVIELFRWVYNLVRL